jgi:hypothetical protein
MFSSFYAFMCFIIGNFIIQHNNWWGEYRLLLVATKASYQLARSTTKDEITKDWDFIHQEVRYLLFITSLEQSLIHIHRSLTLS